MQTTTTLSYRFFFTAVLAVVSFLGASTLTASADYYSFNNGAGGDGTWQNGAGGTQWSDGGTQNLDWDNSLNNVAYFGGSGGMVDVANDVTTNYMVFNAGSDITLNGTGTINVVTNNEVFENDTNNNVTIDNDIHIDDSAAGDRFDITDNGANKLTLNGNISYTGSLSRSAGLDLIFNAGANTTIVLNGSYQGSATTPGRLELTNGTMYLNGDFTNENAGGSLLAVDAGTAYVNTNNLGTGAIDMYGGGGQATPELLTEGARTVSEVVGLNYANGGSISGDIVVGGSTANLSTFTNINLVVTGLTLTAVDSGRVDVGSITGNGDISGLIKTGAGTVVLESASTVPVTNGFNHETPAYVADIQQGTLLINNPSGSAFGSEAGTVMVEAGATLGGNGSVSGQKVVIAGPATPNGPTGILAPGDAGQSNLGINASIGVLNLAGNLIAENGLTMDFKLTPNLDSNYGTPQAGVDNDEIMGAAFTLNGNVTINITSLGGIATGEVYVLFNAADGVTGSPTFTFNVPTGYALDPDYGRGGTVGYIFSRTGTLSVQFIAVPEPSSYAMMLGGLALLAFCLRRKVAFAS
jgi:fibronectin-binding autotransporter adhesin